MADIIYPGSTPKFKFEFAEDTIQNNDELEVDFSYKDEYGDEILLLKKETADCEYVSARRFDLQLYEDDTIEFPEKKNIRVQIRLKTDGFVRGVSDIMQFRSGELIREGAFDSE